VSRRVSPHHAIFDLAHLDTLSDAPGLALSVSARTLYVLQNLVIQDVADVGRYATDIPGDIWYDPVGPLDPGYAVALATIEGVQREVYPLSIYGYTSVWSHREISNPLEAGNYVVDYGGPENGVWEVQALSGANFSRAGIVFIEVLESSGTPSIVLVQETQSAANDFVTWQGKIVLEDPMGIRFTFFGVEAGDNIYTEYHFAQLHPIP